MPTRQLVAYRFEPGTRLEGQLVGALERAESGGAVRVLDVLFVMREPETGELAAVSRAGSASGGMVGDLLDVRLDAAARRAATERALAGPQAEIVRRLGSAIAPGGALAAVLVEHVWADALDEAVGRLGGTQVTNAFVEADRLSDVTEQIDSA